MKGVQIISLSRKGRVEEGFLHIIDNASIPFEIKRVFYTVDTPTGVTRGRHAHHETEMVLIAVQGEIIVKTVTVDGNTKTFVLNNASEGLYLPKLCWHEMNYKASAVQLVVCSTNYNEADYIRDWEQFSNLVQQHGAK
jgi:dTDP-4-dehydrorhamnose 3,5-epimerase-like enzyme